MAALRAGIPVPILPKLARMYISSKVSAQRPAALWACERGCFANCSVAATLGSSPTLSHVFFQFSSPTALQP